MRALRAAGAVLLMVLGALLLVVALVLCVTIILLPLGILLGFVAVKLWKCALHLLLPRPADVRRGLRKGFRVREVRAAVARAGPRTARQRKRLSKKARKARRELRIWPQTRAAFLHVGRRGRAASASRRRRVRRIAG
jgi:hypothetical protein